VSKAENHEKIDLDILQCKADILRARDIVPQSKKKPQGEILLEKTDGKASAPGSVTEASAEKEKPDGLNKSRAGAGLKEGTRELQQEGPIPSFDLGEEIMAEQRKVSAVRRKAPSKKNETEKQDEAFEYTNEQSGLESESTPIIAEIVARDIERLCGDAG